MLLLLLPAPHAPAVHNFQPAGSCTRPGELGTAFALLLLLPAQPQWRYALTGSSAGASGVRGQLPAPRPWHSSSLLSTGTGTDAGTGTGKTLSSTGWVLLIPGLQYPCTGLDVGLHFLLPNLFTLQLGH